MARNRTRSPGAYVFGATAPTSPEDGIRMGIDEVLDASVEAARWHATWSRRWARIYLCLGLPASILAAVAGATGLAASAGRVPAAIIALISAALAAGATFLESGRRREYHQAMSGAWQALANDAHVHQLADIPRAEWLADEGPKALRRLARRRAGLIQLKVPVDEHMPSGPRPRTTD